MVLFTIYNTTAAPNGGMIIVGNLGVGTLTPGTKVDVQGTIRATALNVGIGTTSPTRLCITNGLLETCP